MTVTNYAVPLPRWFGYAAAVIAPVRGQVYAFWQVPRAIADANLDCDDAIYEPTRQETVFLCEWPQRFRWELRPMPEGGGLAPGA